MLDPDVVLRADRSAVDAAAARVAEGAPALVGEMRGAEGVAGTFRGRAQLAQPALVNGAIGAGAPRTGAPARCSR